MKEKVNKNTMRKKDVGVDYRKYFRNIPNKRAIVNNKFLTARRQLKHHVHHVLNRKDVIKLKQLIRIFAETYNLPLTFPLNEWLLELYISNQNEIIRRQEISFYFTDKWRQLRKEVLTLYGCKCMKCEFESESNCVDHIKPRSKYPELELDINNMQVLCTICNLIKSNRTIVDYRTSEHLQKL